MKKIVSFVLLFVLFQQSTFAQRQPIDRNLFFLDDNIINVSLTTDIKGLRGSKKNSPWQPADIVMKFSDSSVIAEKISIQTRGVFRKENCDLASLTLNFKTPASPRLSKLKKMKMVGGCRTTAFFEELVLKEYLVYKMYNHLSTMSFRVRLLRVQYNDSKQKVKPFSQYAFLIEDIEDVADRHNCREKKNKPYATEGTNRQQISLVCIFQYMIGNTDFSIPNYHNVKLMVPKNDTLANPYTVPYDFDFAGVVNAPYAIPRDELGILSVKDRLYRGFPRRMDELEPIIETFKQKEEAIKYTIQSFALLGDRTKDEMLTYLEDFFKMLDNKRTVKHAFIDGARTN